MMESIIVIEKPDDVSWDAIHSTVIEAHQENIRKGLIVRSTLLTPEQMKRQLREGKCFVALDGEKIAGVAAVTIRQPHHWYAKENVAHFVFDAILPEYRGKGIYKLLQQKRYEFVKESGLNIITTNTAATNQRMVAMLPEHGFEPVVYFRVSGSDHDSITWARWLSKRPSKLSCRFHYLKTKAAVVIRNLLKQSENG